MYDRTNVKAVTLLMWMKKKSMYPKFVEHLYEHMWMEGHIFFASTCSHINGEIIQPENGNFIWNSIGMSIIMVSKYSWWHFHSARHGSQLELN